MTIGRLTGRGLNVTLKFVSIFGAQAGGWTETWYRDGSSLANVKSMTDALANTRCGLLSEGAFLEAIRVTVVESVSQSHFEPYAPDFTQGRRYPTPRDSIQTTIVARIESSNGSRRMWQISGVADNLVFFDPLSGKMVFDNVFDGRFQLFLNTLKNAPYTLRVISKDPTNVGERQILSANSLGNGHFQVEVDNCPYVRGDTIRISKVNTIARPFISGTWRVNSVANNIISVDSPIATTSFSAGPGGVVRRQIAAFASIINGTLRAVGNRKRGRAFFVPRGRRRAR